MSACSLDNPFRQGLFVDFVVAGLGFGALIVVIGFAVRDLGPLFWRPTGYAAPAENAELRARWVDRCRAVGTYSSFAGGTVLLVTIVAVAIGLSDRLGALVVAATALVACVAAAGLFVRSGRGLAPIGASTVPVLTVSTLSSDAQPEVTSVRRISRSAPVAVAEVDSPLLDEPDVGPVAALPADDEASIVVEDAPAPLGDSDERPTVAPSPLVAVDEKAASDESQLPVVESSPTQESAAGGFFSSPLLADIGREPLTNGDGTFASSILADVDHEAEADGTALSALLEPDASDPGDAPSADTASEEVVSPDEDRSNPVPSGEDTLIDSRPAQIR